MAAQPAASYREVTQHPEPGTIVDGAARFRRRSTHNPDERPETLWAKVVASDLYLGEAWFPVTVAIRELQYAKVPATPTAISSRLHGRLAPRTVAAACLDMATAEMVSRTRPRHNRNAPYAYTTPAPTERTFLRLSCNLFRDHPVARVRVLAVAAHIAGERVVSADVPIDVQAVATFLGCSRQAVYKALAGIEWTSATCQPKRCSEPTKTASDCQPKPPSAVNQNGLPTRGVHRPSGLNCRDRVRTDELQNGARAPKPVCRDAHMDETRSETTRLPNRAVTWFRDHRPDVADQILALATNGDPDRAELRRRIGCCVQAVTDRGIRSPVGVARRMIADGEPPRDEHAGTARAILRPDPIPHHCPRCGNTVTVAPDRTECCQTCCGWELPWAFNDFGLPLRGGYGVYLQATQPGDTVTERTREQWEADAWAQLTPEEQAAATAAMAEWRERCRVNREQWEARKLAEAEGRTSAPEAEKPEETTVDIERQERLAWIASGDGMAAWAAMRAEDPELARSLQNTPEIETELRAWWERRQEATR